MRTSAVPKQTQGRKDFTVVVEPRYVKKQKSTSNDKNAHHHTGGPTPPVAPIAPTPPVVAALRPNAGITPPANNVAAGFQEMSIDDIEAGKFNINRQSVKKQEEEDEEERTDDLIYLNDVTVHGIALALGERFAKDEIYTSIGPVLVSCNPFKPLPIYGDDQVKLYSDKENPEKENLPPHIFKIAENSFRMMLAEDKKQCVIISGESGAGKTEASKAIMQYISAISGTGGNDQAVDKLKNIVLDSNPVLEAFGNAMTIRNNNSSRFGKYFTLRFSPSNGGTPLGGGIQNYLLEKSRVVSPGKGERNYHIFYQVLSNSVLCGELGLDDNPSLYNILKVSGMYKIANAGGSINDGEELKFTMASMDTVGLDAETKTSFFELVAAILFLGNVEFKPVSKNGAEGSDVADGNVDVEKAAGLLQIEAKALRDALLTRTMNVVGAESYQVPNNPSQAKLARDALAKDLYNRCFNYLVKKINDAMEAVGGATRLSMKRKQNEKTKTDLSIGVLDIFGFEIFDKNLFEQLCINYVNERLQQTFIQLTLKSEQEDYTKEGIPWVEVPFFDNAVVIELIHGNQGVFPCLDDVGKVAHANAGSEVDEKFLDSLTKNAKTHAHFKGKQGRFTIVHYAGDVEYQVEGFIDSNKDTVNKDLLVLIKGSKAAFLNSVLYPEEVDPKDRTRGSASLSAKLKKSTDELVKTLMQCTPYYVRCIKSNDTKSSDEFDKAKVEHQVKYLGLMENIKVRRAGFAFRLDFTAFNLRFKILLGNAPAAGDGKTVCTAIITKAMASVASLSAENEIKYGKTKVFIRRAESYFGLQEARKKLIKVPEGANGEWRDGMDLETLVDQEIVLTNLLESFVGLNVTDEQMTSQLDELIPKMETLQFTETMDRKNVSTGDMEEVLLAVTDKTLYLFEVKTEQPDKAAKRDWIMVGGNWVRNPNPAPQVKYTLKQLRKAEIANVTAVQIRQMSDTLLMLTFKSDGVKIGLLMNAGQSFVVATDKVVPVPEVDRDSIKSMARPQTNLMWRISTSINRKSQAVFRPMSIRPESMRPMSKRLVSMRQQVAARPGSGRPLSIRPGSQTVDASLKKYDDLKQLGVPFSSIRMSMKQDGVSIPKMFLPPEGFDATFKDDPF